jgi:hypothetical protein
MSAGAVTGKVDPDGGIRQDPPGSDPPVDRAHLRGDVFDLDHLCHTNFP